MSLGENIHNAVIVLQKTYENIDKLITYCRTVSEKETNYALAVSKFLRFKSDNDCSGWMINDFILLFQDKNDKKLDNGWRDGAVFVMEINLHDKSVPMVFLSLFEYININGWSTGCSPASYDYFYSPLRNNNMNETELTKSMISLTPNLGMEDKIAKEYWGLKRIVYTKIPLIELTAENTKDIIFGSFNSLKKHETTKIS